jgi:hypothetical protein
MKKERRSVSINEDSLTTSNPSFEALLILVQHVKVYTHIDTIHTYWKPMDHDFSGYMVQRC